MINRNRSAMWAGIICVLFVATGLHAGVFPIEGVSATDPGATFGTQIQQVDAVAEGYPFGGFVDGLRNLNIISTVYQTPVELTFGSIVVPADGYIYTYELDFGTGGPASTAVVNDLQLARTVENANFGVTNPGQRMALAEIVGTGYNTAAPYENVAPDQDPTWSDLLIPGAIDISFIQYSYASGESMTEGNKRMLMLFTTPETQIYRAGYTAGDPAPLEGGDVVGGGDQLSNIPVLIPIVPEPATSAVVLLGLAGLILRRRR